MTMEKIIDKKTWNRKEIFDFFGGLSDPFYMVSFRQDITGLYEYTKKNNLSFYYSMCYLCTKAINEIDAFHYVIRDDEVVYIDKRNPSFTDLKKDSDNFYIVTLKMTDDLKNFCEAAKEKSMKQNVFIENEKETDDLVYLTCLPWLDITAVTNERDLLSSRIKNDSIPRICWGKFIRIENRVEIGFSFEVNHRLIDGVHIGKFSQKLSELIRSIENE